MSENQKPQNSSRSERDKARAAELREIAARQPPIFALLARQLNKLADMIDPEVANHD